MVGVSKLQAIGLSVSLRAERRTCLFSGRLPVIFASPGRGSSPHKFVGKRSFPSAPSARRMHRMATVLSPSVKKPLTDDAPQPAAFDLTQYGLTVTDIRRNLS